MSENKPKYLFRIPQKALIIKDGKYLILKRAFNGKSFEGLWDLPGGRLEHKEELREALVREVKEETNLDVKIGEIVVAKTNEVRDGYAVFIVYNSKIISGIVKNDPADHSEFKWATKEEILKLEVTPIVRKYFEEN